MELAVKILGHEGRYVMYVMCHEVKIESIWEGNSACGLFCKQVGDEANETYMRINHFKYTDTYRQHT